MPYFEIYLWLFCRTLWRFEIETKIIALQILQLSGCYLLKDSIDYASDDIYNWRRMVFVELTYKRYYYIQIPLEVDM